MTNRRWLEWRIAGGFTLTILAGACLGAELSSRAYPPLLTAGGSGDSSTPLVSADGRYVVFVGAAENLTASDGNQLQDVFLRDRETRATSLLSAHAADSPPGRGHAGSIAISADANLIAYEVTQLSTSPLPGPQGLQVTNTAGFLVDRGAGLRRSIGIADGLPLPFVSGDPPETNWSTYARAAATELQFAGDGRRLIFQTPGQPHPNSPTIRFQLLVELNLVSGNTNLFCTGAFPQTLPNADLRGVQLSTDGKRAVFFSAANNLHPLDDWQSGSQFDIYAYDRTANSNILASIAADGTRGGSNNSESPDISGDGRYVVFTSTATNLVAADTHHNSDVFLRDLTLETTTLISSNLAGITTSTSGPSSAPAISGDGRWTAFFSNAGDLVASDPNSTAGDVFLRDNQSGVVTRISNHSDWHGRLAASAPPPQLTPDGSFVLYQAPGSGLFQYERASEVNRLLTTDVTADSPSMSPDGRFVVFSSQSVPGFIGGTDAHRQVYLFDRELDSFELISARAQSLPVVTANDASRFEAGVIATADELLLARSYATDLGLRADDRQLRLWNLTNTSVPLAVNLGAIAGLPVELAQVVNLTASADGRWLAFDYDEPALAAAQGNNGWQVVLHDRVNGINRVLNHSLADADGPQFPAVSPDGRHVVWRPSGSQLELYEVGTAITTSLSPSAPTASIAEPPVFAPDGAHVYFRYRDGRLPGFQAATVDSWTLFQLDVANLSINQIAPPRSDSSNGEVGAAHLSRNRQFVAYELSAAGSGTGVYVKPTDSEARALVSTDGFNPRVDDLGSVVVFESLFPIAGLPDTNNTRDVILKRLSYLGVSEPSVISINAQGSAAGNGRSRLLDVSPDGRFVLFHSWASDLVANDTNQFGDLFLRDLRIQTTLMLTIGQNHELADGNTSARAMFNREGTKVIFESYARNLVGGDYNQARDVFTATLELPDGDRDGLPDSWELTWFGTLDQDGTADSDGDGATDRDEFTAGTSPINDHSVLTALTVRSGALGFPQVLWAAVPGRRYRVQSKDDFNHPGWNDLPGVVTAVSSTGMLLDTAINPSSQRFYRVLVLP